MARNSAGVSPTSSGKTQLSSKQRRKNRTPLRLVYQQYSVTTMATQLQGVGRYMEPVQAVIDIVRGRPQIAEDDFRRSPERAKRKHHGHRYDERIQVSVGGPACCFCMNSLTRYSEVPAGALSANVSLDILQANRLTESPEGETLRIDGPLELRLSQTLLLNSARHG